MIDLSDLHVQVATPRLLDWGSDVTPPLGGVTQRLHRLGSRYAIDVTVPPMMIEPVGRRWIQRLMRGKTDGVSLAFPQVEFNVGAPGVPAADGAVAGGTALPLKGLTPHYALREGQWLSVRRVSTGRSYLHSINGQEVASAGGQAVVSVTPMLRAMLANNDLVNLAKPVIEGSLSGDETAWTLEMTRTVGLQFTITERE